MTRWLRRLRYWRNQRQMQAELAEEMEHHRSLLVRDGGAPSAWGNTTYAREDARAVWIWPWLESLWRDAAYGLRSMRNQPGFTAVALLGLGLAIGVNTSLFTAFNGVALRPWPVPDPGRVVNVGKVIRDGGRDFSLAEMRFFEKHAKSVTGVVAMRDGERVKAADRPLNATYTTAGYFSVLRIPMALGRGFLAEEDRVGAPQAVAVLSYLAWESAFGGDPLIVGKRVALDETPFTIVGVTGPDFLGTAPTRNDVWIPFAAKKILRPSDPHNEALLTQPDFCCTPVAARLAPGATREQAEAEFALLDARFEEEHKLERGGAVRLTSTAWINILGRKKAPIIVFSLLFVAVTLVLLLACANVGNLLLARAAMRRREIAVRLSIGGSRLRIVRQLLVESATLAAGSAAIGVGIAFVLPSAIVRRLAAEQTFYLRPDLTVLGYTVAIAVVACLAFGLAPALHCTRGNTSAALKGESGVGRLRLRSVLLGTQVAISVMLLTGAGMMVRGLARTQAQDPGFDVHGVTLFKIELPARDAGPMRVEALSRQLMAELERSPEFPVNGLAAYEPLGNGIVSTSFRLPEEPESTRRRIAFQEASGGFFDALRLPIVAGRNFTPRDAGRDVAILNETAARTCWPSQNPVGKTLFSNGRSREIVGVVKDANLANLNGVQSTMFFPMAGSFGTPILFVRDRSPAAVERITAAIRRLEPRAEVRARPLAENFERSFVPSRAGAAIAGGMGMLALTLSSIGMAGVFAYVVRQRTREIGVRMALGARPGDVVRLVLGSNVRVLVVGLIVGAGGAAAASVAMSKVLPGVETGDPAAYAGVAMLLALAAAIAGVAPARRAARVDPVRALRWE
jgi:predicted permease